MTDHRQGPVRSEAARLAILEATARLFMSKGYDHLTMEGIAAEAGVGKQTIYRWWPSKGDVVADCLLDGLLLPDSLRPPETGDIRADLVDWITGIFHVLARPDGEGLLRSIIAAAAGNADVGRRIYSSLGATSSMADRIRKAIHEEGLAVDTPIEEVGEAIVGAVILRALSRSTIEEAGARRLVGALLG
ncbi:TetR/AcrR family transcriptional regulator [Glaciihabitans arcticus]|uniref:TetR/AcrR family transcriptional regulator n=1 Tax=Glaciihabitans arcticus TaxID=2668039 RepID=A0A4Q9GVU0_9MICO|nr:TetR/AcrR family transcriptional regulator [Glaciihabitans arcticus]TBN58384.1 TetR/AcrR family transcriptional regulator [Glaciihabitans arcticus]